jgi:N-acetylmuramoyl-L-alanine amidase
MHYTGMTSGAAALAWLCNPESQVSAHYLVEEDGQVFALVEEDRRAWHAGVAEWRGATNINDISIGIEVVNAGHEHGYRPYPPAQMEAVRDLAWDIMQRHDIPADGVMAHSDVAPLRKADPGELFPWEWLAGYGVGVWVKGCETKAASLGGEEVAAQLHKFGYMFARTEEEYTKVIEAFQRHYRPACVDGMWDGECQSRLTALLRKMPQYV